MKWFISSSLNLDLELYDIADIAQHSQTERENVSHKKAMTSPNAWYIMTLMFCSWKFLCFPCVTGDFPSWNNPVQTKCRFLLIRSQSIVSSAQVEKTDTFSFVKWYGQSDGGGLGCFTGVQKNCSWYYTASLFHDNPFLYHPCMVYLPTCSWFLWEKRRNIPYVDAMGFQVGNFCCSSVMFIFRKAWEPIHIITTSYQSHSVKPEVVALFKRDFYSLETVTGSHFPHHLIDATFRPSVTRSQCNLKWKWDDRH